jgi:cellulose synthase/poly-beta-1,6-N-acetylglucosamine synthase-like glycosyltransferase
MMETIFWVCCGLIIYSYCLYPIILLVLKQFKPAVLPPSTVKYSPNVSIVISVYNEESILPSKIENLRRLEYPQGKAEFIIGSDGSSDSTNEILQTHLGDNLRARIFTERRGKAFVLNDLVAMANGDVVVFSDANTMFEPGTVQKLVQQFEKVEVGAVCGELRLVPRGGMANGVGEISYWTYENNVKSMESDIKSLIGATGAIYAIRKALFKPLPTEKVIMDDFLISLSVIVQGYEVKYEPRALAYEPVTSSIANEFRRKIRISAGNFYGISEFMTLLSPKFGFVAFALWSHKIIRWFVPFLLLAILASSIVLASDKPLFSWMVILELVFILLGGVGFLCERIKIRIPPIDLVYYFLAMNIALLVGFMKFLFNLQSSRWDIVR